MNNPSNPTGTDLEGTLEAGNLPFSANYNQLFTVEEALVRLGQNHQSGELMIINSAESVQIFVKDGFVVHAQATDMTGEEALKYGLDLPAVNFVWVADARSLINDIHIDIKDYLLRRSLSRDVFSQQTISAQKRETLALPHTQPKQPADDLADVLDTGFYLIADKYSTEKMVLNKTVNLVGREIYCDWVINDLRVSRKHCLLQLTSQGVLVRDLGTINGTYVNGKVVGDSYLKVHDKLSLGGYVLTLKREKPENKAVPAIDKSATRALFAKR